MCMRKIIGKGVFKIVPVINGCNCPTIVQIRDIDVEPITVNEIIAEALPPTYPHPHPHTPVTHTCRDIKTVFRMNEYPVTFRFCNCPGDMGCVNLPRTDLSINKILNTDERECWSEDGRGVYFEGVFEDDEK